MAKTKMTVAGMFLWEVDIEHEARTTCEPCRGRLLERGVDAYFRRHELDRKYGETNSDEGA